MHLTAIIDALPALRAVAYGLSSPSGADRRTADHCFLREGPHGERQVCLIFAHSWWAAESVTVNGHLVWGRSTPLIGRSLDQWFTERYATLIHHDWQPIFVSPRVEMPPFP